MPLDALSPCRSSSEAGGDALPRAVVARGRVVAADGLARTLGVGPGMGQSSAWGLAPRLAVQERDGAEEARALDALACWAGRFTPQVSLDGPAGLVLEIGGCLRLFGGLDALLARACGGVLAQGYALCAACAPTPLVARWLANGAPWLEPEDWPGRWDAGAGTGAAGQPGAAPSFSPELRARKLALAGPTPTPTASPSPSQAQPQPQPQGGAMTASGASTLPWLPDEAPEALSADPDFLACLARAVPRCDGGAALAALLAPLSLECLDLEAGVCRRLANFGMTTLGGLLGLPRAGLSRRFGPSLAGDLARALGEVPDPRARFPFPEHFRQFLELPARVEQAGALLFAARRLLESLQGWLAVRGAGVSRCTLTLEHEYRAPTDLVLGFAGLTRDGARLTRVLGERLGQLTLAAPVRALVLQADEVGELAGEEGVLPGQSGPGEGDPARVAVVLERLRARLGEDKVYGLTTVADYRPERASRKCPPDGLLATRPGEEGPGRSSAAPPPPGPRPLWLLEPPRPLDERQGRPWHAGPLSLLAGPERIESGWWDEGEAGPEAPGEAPALTGDLCRDYFVAANPRGEWLWIFRDARGWFLHGSFL